MAPVWPCEMCDIKQLTEVSSLRLGVTKWQLGCRAQLLAHKLSETTPAGLGCVLPPRSGTIGKSAILLQLRTSRIRSLRFHALC